MPMLGSTRRVGFGVRHGSTLCVVALAALAPVAASSACATSGDGDGVPGGGPSDDAGDVRPDASAPDDATAKGDGADASDAAPQPEAQAPVDTAWRGRAPAMPLIVRNPYVSTWLPADAPTTAWPAFWSGAVKGMTGLARIDGAPFVVLGIPTGVGSPSPLTLVSHFMTPTKTELVLGGAGVEITLDFLSPVEPGDVKRQSQPIGYVTAKARATDGGTHSVSLYFDISGEWAHGDSTEPVTWARESVAHAGGTLTVLSFSPATPKPAVEVNEYPAWGTAFLAAATAPNLTTAVGADTDVRNRAFAQSTLDGTLDSRMPRKINDAWPVLGVDFDLGTLAATAPATPQVTLIVGHVRDPAIRYLGTDVSPLWKAYYPSWQGMVADAFDDGPAAAARAAALDQRIVADALAAGGPSYAALCTLALRQAFGGTELVGTAANPWMMLKEISSDGNVSTVDVIYPASPVFLYTNPALLQMLLAPVVEYAEHRGWPKAWAPHDLGSAYPNAAGHVDGNEESMPVEESANMLLMMAAYAQRAGTTAGPAYATAHYAIAKQWADYLAPNTLDPVNQNQTDDFTGFIDHSVNLALKGILGLGAMGVLAQLSGNTADAQKYTDLSKSLIAQWATKAQDVSGTHLLLKYDQPGSWSLKYNVFYDRVLGLGLVPPSVMSLESTFYKTVANAVGVPLDLRHTYSKIDWQLWTAASTDDAALRTKLIESVLAFATTSTARVPFSDWYDTVSGQQQGFQARPVVGGVFALLAKKGSPSIVP